MAAISHRERHASFPTTVGIIRANPYNEQALTDLEADLGALQTVSGLAAGATDFATFTGNTIGDGLALKPILQQLETAIEGMAGALTPQGTWNASTNAPDLTAAAQQVEGHYYRVATAGATDPGNGVTDWLVGDHIFYANGAWHKVDNTDLVASVHGRTGVVVAANGDYTASQVTFVPGATGIAATDTNAAVLEVHNDLATLVGVTQGDVNMGTYTGNLLNDNETAKQNIQQLETAVEAISRYTATAVQTANYTAAANDLILCDVSGGTFVVSPPAAPAVGTRFAVADATNSTSITNFINVDFGAASQSFMGGNNNDEVNETGAAEYFFAGGATGWVRLS